jgi:hypothetical protein
VLLYNLPDTTQLWMDMKLVLPEGFYLACNHMQFVDDVDIVQDEHGNVLRRQRQINIPNGLSKDMMKRLLPLMTPVDMRKAALNTRITAYWPEPTPASHATVRKVIQANARKWIQPSRDSRPVLTYPQYRATGRDMQLPMGQISEDAPVLGPMWCRIEEMLNQR